MSQRNVEAVRRAIAAHNAGDADGFLALWDAECEWFTVTGSQLDATPYRGHAGIRQYLADREETWAELEFDPERILEGKDDDVVVAVGFLRGLGRGSAVPVEQRIGLIYRFRGQGVRHCRAYADPEVALEAAGTSLE
jgi:ketosteroid isomerase-like protein